MKQNHRERAITKSVIVRTVDLVKSFKVKKSFFSEARWIRPVDSVSLEIFEGETLGIVGESGCGKTTIGRTLLRLLEPNGGRIFFMDRDITEMPDRELRRFRKNMQIVFQDPYSSLNPRMTIYDILRRPIRIFGLCDAKEEGELILETLRGVGLDKQHLLRYPHEFSGGQRQRIAIARAIISRPKFIVLDEPTSALDVSVQAQIINLLSDLKQKHGLTYLFISHDISIVKHISDRIAVMYLGSIVEIGPKNSVFDERYHPYTEMLISSVPLPDLKRRMELRIDTSEVPSLFTNFRGCKFVDRCKYRMPRCDNEKPPLFKVGEEHYVRCFLYERDHGDQFKAGDEEPLRSSGSLPQNL